MEQTDNHLRHTWANVNVDEWLHANKKHMDEIIEGKVCLAFWDVFVNGPPKRRGV
jgi:hypothetical protein